MTFQLKSGHCHLIPRAAFHNGGYLPAALRAAQAAGI